MRLAGLAILPIVFAARMFADALPCDLSVYRAMPDLDAAIDNGVLTLTWDGDRSEAIRLRFMSADGRLLIQEIAVRPTGGMWTQLAANVRPEFARKTDDRTGERSTDAIGRCEVETDGARLEVHLSGGLRFTVYRGTNLIRAEIVSGNGTAASETYDMGFRGLPIWQGANVVWREASDWRSDALEGPVTDTPATVRAANRQLVADLGKPGSIAIFAPPHGKFQSAWYRKDGDASWSVGIRGDSSIYLYATAAGAMVAATSASAFTREDRYKAVSGYQIGYQIADGGDRPATVNYVKVPGDSTYRDSLQMTSAFERGDYFTTTGEILFHSVAVEGTGNERTLVVDLEWTFPLDSLEIAAGTERKSVSATGMPAFGDYLFRIPFHAMGEDRIRVRALDSAGDEAITAPVRIASGAVQ